MDNKSTSALQQQSSCDNNNVCDDHNKRSNSQPSWLSSQLSSLSVLLPSNFLNLPPRWRDWFIRGQSGIFLISCFFILISLGPLGLFSLTLIVQVIVKPKSKSKSKSKVTIQRLGLWLTHHPKLFKADKMEVSSPNQKS